MCFKKRKGKVAHDGQAHFWQWGNFSSLTRHCRRKFFLNFFSIFGYVSLISTRILDSTPNFFFKGLSAWKMLGHIRPHRLYRGMCHRHNYYILFLDIGNVLGPQIGVTLLQDPYPYLAIGFWIRFFIILIQNPDSGS